MVQTVRLTMDIPQLLNTVAGRFTGTGWVSLVTKRVCAMTRKVVTWPLPVRALKGLYGLEGKESGSRFGSREDKVSLPGLKLPDRVPGFGEAKHFTSRRHL